jgi:hypothetical protein
MTLMTESLLGFALLCGFAALFGMIFRKMGYSSLAGILAVLPLVNIVCLVYLAAAKWPIERELAERPDPDQPAPKDHLTLMFQRAESFERRGEYAEALRLFELLAEELEGRPGTRVAAHCAERLRKRTPSD